jgi:hypothetical protein
MYMYICILYIWCYIIFKCLSVNQFDKTKLFRPDNKIYVRGPMVIVG